MNWLETGSSDSEGCATQPSGSDAMEGGEADRQFPDLLRSQRLRAGLTQQALADLSTVSPRAIRDLEAGRARGRRQTLGLLADGLGLRGLTRELFIDAGTGGRRVGMLDGDLGAALPRPVDALIGRDPEVRAMVDALESGRRRMVSISGLAGVGKTRVAMEVAGRLSSRRRWPVLWIGTDSGARIEPGALDPSMRLLQSLIESDTGDVSRLRQLVGRHDTLLVLDAVADARIPAAVEKLLGSCPGVRVISTSRSPWHVAGARAAAMSALATPGPEWDAAPSVVALAGVPSVRLLVDRLSEVRPEFALRPDNASAVAELCRKLDGLPLALELAAGCFSVLNLQQLIDLPVPELLDLTTPDRSGGERETIGSLIDSSLERLSIEHRTTLRGLVKLDRAWTVAEVVGALGRPLDEVVDELTVLVGYGLVRPSHGERATAFNVPNLVRAVLLRQEAGVAAA